MKFQLKILVQTLNAKNSHCCAVSESGNLKIHQKMYLIKERSFVQTKKIDCAYGYL
jgi:hypothetical protein